MTELECYGCQNQLYPLQYNKKPEEKPRNALQSCSEAKLEENIPTAGSNQSANNQLESQSPIHFKCNCCQNIYCPRCCQSHLEESHETPEKSQQTEKVEEKDLELKEQKFIEQKIEKNLQIICQECEEDSSGRYCQNCEQYLCEKCSFKIHNKGKRAKHSLDTSITRNLMVRKVMVIVGGKLSSYLKSIQEESTNVQQSFQTVVNRHKMAASNTLFLLDQPAHKQLADLPEQKWLFQEYDIQTFKYEDLKSMQSKHPFFRTCIMLILGENIVFQKNIFEEYNRQTNHYFSLEVVQEWKLLQVERKHERVKSQKISIKHNKNISNFSNVSGISKIQHQSVLSNEPSDLFSNEESLNLTLNNNQSILMMGAYSDRSKEQKETQKNEIKQIEKDYVQYGHHRIYSIRQQNSHNSANNISSSTENSVRRRNKKWPIPYFQPFRTSKPSKHEKGSDKENKYKAEVYLRELAQKGILMIRKEKAEPFIMDPDVSRRFVRNIGQKEIEYVAYIIEFISVECLTWVIQSIKEDKMTPSQKLIQSRLKESFDLKVNMKLWDSIIKYLQSSQYDEDFDNNASSRYIPRINVVKYGDEFLLEFEKTWLYEDQQLLDEDQQQWKQFKNLITDYFSGHNQITGGRYGCVQYVKLNGQKPLRKCSLGKLSLYVQEAINKGIIRYHKTLLVSNSENNNSFCSQLGGKADENTQWVQMQRELKIMALQLALIDMFLETQPKTPISLAQIPLNLKKSIIFDYTLVELGFPKLKNLLNTLSDKLLLESSKTHITYELTNNGAEAIDKMRRQVYDYNQKFMTYILQNLSSIIMYYQSMTLQDLYNQLTIRLGFPFEHKLFHLPDFYSFVLYYCTNIATVQYINGVFVVYSKYQQPYPAYHQPTHRATYSQDQFPTQNYHLSQSYEFSKTALKKVEQKEEKPLLLSLKIDENEQKHATSSTPRFSNNFIERGRLDSMGWSDFLEDDKQEKGDDENDENHSREIEQHIINILDDGQVSASRPKTVIVNQGTEQQFLLLPKLEQNADQLQSFGGDTPTWAEQDPASKTNTKSQHTRFKSTNEAPVKHSRQYSTAANTRK